MPKQKQFLWASIGIASYLLLLYLNAHYFRLDHVLLGVVQESTLLLVMFAQVVLLFLAFRLWRTLSYDFPSLIFGSVLLLSLTTTLSWGSLLYEIFLGRNF